MEQEETQRAMLRIDAVASRQYEADKAAEEEYKRSTYGTWVRSFLCIIAVPLLLSIIH